MTAALTWWLASLQLAGAVVLSAAGIADRLTRSRSAAIRRQIWALAIVLALTLPLARVAVAGPDFGMSVELEVVAVAAIGIWLIGAAILLARWWIGIANARRLLATTTAIEAGPWRESLERLAMNDVELRACPEIGSPMLLGVIRPVLLVPTDLGSASASEREAILLHELAHLRRADNLLLHLGVWVRAIYWVTPLAWWSFRRLRETAETAADDAVLDAGVVPTRYAAQLVASARAQLERAGRVAAGQLRERVEAILDGKRRREGVERRRPAIAMARLVTISIVVSALVTACEAL